MAIDEEAARRLEKSMSHLADMADPFFLLLFDRLQQSPDIGDSFPEQVTELLRPPLMETLAMLVMNASEPESLVGPMETLGRRHVHYRVEPTHYAAFRNELLAAIRHVHREAWTAKLEADWHSLLDLASMMMVDGQQIETDLLEAVKE